MTILIVDDEQHCVNNTARTVEKTVPDAEISTFTEPEKALAFAEENRIDIAFLDIEMGTMNGIALAKKLKKHNPKLNIIFVTAYPDYSLEAYKVFPSSYLLKPLDKDEIEEQIDNLRFPVVRKGVRAVTFGNFELLLDGNPVHFARSKSKEILAYLIDQRGGRQNRKQIAAVVYDGEAYIGVLQDGLNHALHDLKKSLCDAGINNLLKKENKSYFVNTDAFTCDLYEWYDNVPSAVNAFQGEYMSEYSWGEERLGDMYER